MNPEAAACVVKIYTLADEGHGHLKISKAIQAGYGDRFGTVVK